MISYLHMVNAWSLAASILNGTFEEDYPIMKKKEIEHSDAYYDYTRNDPNAENPFTDPADQARADGLDYEIDYYNDSADYMADIDDMYSHHLSNAYSSYNDGWTQEYHREQLEKLQEPMAHYFKYHEAVSYTHLTLPTSDLV